MDDHFPQEEVVPLTAALLHDPIRVGYKLNAVENPDYITTILVAKTDATVVNKPFNSPDYIVLGMCTADNRTVRGDEIPRTDRNCSSAPAILDFASDNANSPTVVINDFYGNSFNQS
jgi:hypothetical protein